MGEEVQGEVRCSRLWLKCQAISAEWRSIPSLLPAHTITIITWHFCKELMVSALHTGLYTATSTNPNRNLNPNTTSRGGGCYSSVDGLTCIHKRSTRACYQLCPSVCQINIRKEQWTSRLPHMISSKLQDVHVRGGDINLAIKRCFYWCLWSTQVKSSIFCLDIFAQISLNTSLTHIVQRHHEALHEKTFFPLSANTKRVLLWSCVWNLDTSTLDRAHWKHTCIQPRSSKDGLIFIKKKSFTWTDQGHTRDPPGSYLDHVKTGLDREILFWNMKIRNC